MGRGANLITMWAAALAGALFILWRGSQDVFWHDFGPEAWPAFEALVDNDVAGFLRESPVYAGSLLLRAPFAYLAGLLGGDDNWIFRAGALPAVAALAWLAVTLAGRLRAQAPDRVSWMLPVVLVAASPIAWQTFEYGHPEDVLAAACSVGAVLVARGGRTLLAGVLVGVAVASKQWAVVAVLPALLAAPRVDLRMLVPALAIPAALVAPAWLADANFGAEAAGVATTGGQFHPQSIWWLLGIPGPPLPDGTPGTVAPAWLSPLPKPLIVVVGVVLAAVWGTVRRRRPAHDVLLLLAVLFLLRCVLDPWNLVYYHLPFVVALTAWEVHAGRRPWLALAATGLVWLSFVVIDARTGMLPFAVYHAWALPLLAGLALRLAAPRAKLLRRLPSARRRAAELVGAGGTSASANAPVASA